ncbi:MAG TPA: hypothetical protein VGB04_06245 [Allosphingosinicella sp.]
MDSAGRTGAASRSGGGGGGGAAAGRDVGCGVCHSADVLGEGGGWSQEWRQDAQRTWRPAGPTALSGTT